MCRRSFCLGCSGFISMSFIKSCTREDNSDVLVVRHVEVKEAT